MMEIQHPPSESAWVAVVISLTPTASHKGCQLLSYSLWFMICCVWLKTQTNPCCTCVRTGGLTHVLQTYDNPFLYGNNHCLAGWKWSASSRSTHGKLINQALLHLCENGWSHSRIANIWQPLHTTHMVNTSESPIYYKMHMAIQNTVMTYVQCLLIHTENNGAQAQYNT